MWSKFKPNIYQLLVFDMNWKYKNVIVHFIGNVLMALKGHRISYSLNRIRGWVAVVLRRAYDSCAQNIIIGFSKAYPFV